MKAKLKLFT